APLGQRSSSSLKIGRTRVSELFLAPIQRLAAGRESRCEWSSWRGTATPGEWTASLARFVLLGYRATTERTDCRERAMEQSPCAPCDSNISRLDDIEGDERAVAQALQFLIEDDQALLPT